MTFGPITRREAIGLIGTGAAGYIAGVRPAEAVGIESSSSATAVPPASTALRVLFLGGTGFIGPHMVRQALSRGHQVTIFSRGRSSTHLFPEAQRLIGDRDGQLEALRGKSWDVVIDNTGYVPAQVRASAELLRGSVGHYFFTSTSDAYRDYHVANMSENYPLATLPADAAHDVSRYYGPLKALCEEIIANTYPSSHTITRPGWIVGPGDTALLLPYWIMRVDGGGELLAPGTPDDPTQFIDARDLAAWTIAMAESPRGGRYNAVGPSMKFGELLSNIKALTATAATFTWVDADFLNRNAVKPYFGMPLWWPPRNDYAPADVPGGLGGGIGAFTMNDDKAQAAGLTHRATTEILRDTLHWCRSELKQWPADGKHPYWPDGQLPGLTVARERELLAAWKARS